MILGFSAMPCVFSAQTSSPPSQLEEEAAGSRIAVRRVSMVAWRCSCLGWIDVDCMSSLQGYMAQVWGRHCLEYLEFGRIQGDARPPTHRRWGCSVSLCGLNSLVKLIQRVCIHIHRRAHIISLWLRQIIFTLVRPCDTTLQAAREPVLLSDVRRRHPVERLFIVMSIVMISDDLRLAIAERRAWLSAVVKDLDFLRSPRDVRFPVKRPGAY